MAFSKEGQYLRLQGQSRSQCVEPESPAINHVVKRRDSSEGSPKLILKSKNISSTEDSDAAQQNAGECAAGNSFSSNVSKGSLISRVRGGQNSNKSGLSLAERRSLQVPASNNNSMNSSCRSEGQSFGDSVLANRSALLQEENKEHLSFDGDIIDRKRAFSINILCQQKKDSTKVDPRKSLLEGKYNIPLSTKFLQKLSREESELAAKAGVQVLTPEEAILKFLDSEGVCPISTSDYIKDVVSFCPESRVVQLTNSGSDTTKIPSYESAKLS